VRNYIQKFYEIINKEKKMYRKFLAIFTLLSFLIYIAGCSTMRHVTYQELSGPEKPPSVLVKMDDGTKYKIKEPRVEQNKLIGKVDGEGYKEFDFLEIEWIRVNEVDSKKTLKMATLGAVGAGILIWILASSDKSERPA
jgi:hypothetical protein